MSHRQPPASHASPGFTLIELLVVITIIALLIAILLPALQQARATARTAKCAATVRSLSLACHSYATDNADSLPPIANNGNAAGSYGRPTVFWTGGPLTPTSDKNWYLQFYMTLTRNVTEAFVCPEIIARGETPIDLTAGGRSYKYQRVLGGDDPLRHKMPAAAWTAVPWRLDEIKASSRQALFNEGGFTTASPSRGSLGFTNFGSGYHVSSTVEVVHHRTEGTISTVPGTGINNMGFCDGSVRGVQINMHQWPGPTQLTLPDDVYIDPYHPTETW